MKEFKYHFIQDWGTYGNQTLVIVGEQDIEKVLRKTKTPEEIIEEYKNSDCEVAAKEADGFVYDFQNSATILWLKKYDPKDWSTFDTMVHEIVHLIQKAMMEMRGMEKEYEAQAYQVEYLFKNIRNKINKEYERRNKVVQTVPKGAKKKKSSPKAKED
jgi:hypothetical protein